MPDRITRAVPARPTPESRTKSRYRATAVQRARLELPEIRQPAVPACRGSASDAGNGRKSAHPGWHQRCGLHRPTCSTSSSVLVRFDRRGPSPRMRTVFDFVRVIADSESNVLIVGETGTGKETIASLIHHSSRRRAGPFVAVSCAILTETLIESELFGHERGAFTGALKDHAGRFETADGGTIFLDDIDDVPPVGAGQAPARAAEPHHRARRRHPRDPGRRARHHRIEAQPAAAGRRRAVPRGPVLPAQRRADLAAAAARAARGHPGADRPLPAPLLRGGAAATVPALSPSCARRSQRYAWPGNVRELENACERIAQTCTCSMVRVGCMPASLLFQRRRRHCTPPPAAPSAAALGRVSLDARLHEVEAHLISWALEASHGNKSRAAELLRIKRSTLGDRIRRLGLDHRASDAPTTGPTSPATTYKEERPWICSRDRVPDRCSSRRLGRSLGVNLSPAGRKTCNYNCAYCQYGWTDFPARGAFPGRRTSSTRSIARWRDDPDVDSITVAGNGEPTLHPAFGADRGRAVRTCARGARRTRSWRCCRTVRRSTGSTSSTACAQFDTRCMKLDAGDATTFRLHERAGHPARHG